jgi:hypothetical protein
MKCPVSRQLKQDLTLLLSEAARLVALRGSHGILTFRLCFRGPRSCHLGLSPILHWGLRSWCSVAGVSRPLEAVLLAGLTFQEFAFIILPLLGFGPLREDSFVHQGVEVRIDLWGKQGPEFWA